MEHTVFLAFGSNLGNKGKNITRALELLEKEGLKPVLVSRPLTTAPEGFDSANDFLNSAAKFTTNHPPLEVLKITQRIERTLGRTRKSRGGIYHDRTIDIDILFYDNLTVSTPELTIPHPHIAARLFVLQPLCEIAPDFRHPVNGKTMKELLESACKNRATL